MLSDLRHAVRLLRRAPGFTAAAVLTLALGLGATTTIFAVAYGVLLRPLPISRADRVVAIFATNREMGSSREPVSGVRFEAWRNRTDAFVDMAATSAHTFDLMLGGVAERIDGEIVSGNFFELLGTSPVHGRVFTSRDEQKAAAAVPCVISEGLWRRRFAADPSVLGTSVMAQGLAMTIVGVMPDAFSRWRQSVDIWAPYRLTPSLLPPDILNRDGMAVLYVLGRLAPDGTIDHARTVISALDAQVDVALHGAEQPGSATVVGLRDTAVDATLRRSLWLLSATAILVLILASANVASLLLARSVSRRREMATRAAVGATSARLLRQLLSETALLAAIGACLGLLVAKWTVPILVSLAPAEVARVAIVVIDLPAVIFTVVATLSAVVAVGAVPAHRARRSDVVSDLRLASGSSPSTGTMRGPALLVFGQTAVATPLVAAAILMVASFVRLQAIHPGFESRQLLTMTLGIPDEGYGTPEAALALHDQVLERVSGLPGVEAVATEAGDSPVDYLARDRSIVGVSITVEGGKEFLNGRPGDAPFVPGHRRVTPSYFDTLGLRLVAGRRFTDDDRHGAVPVAVINGTMARRHWPGRNPIGRRVNFQLAQPGRPVTEPWTEIVGVVTDARQHRFEEQPRPEIYTPLAQTPYVIHTASLLIRSVTPPAELARPVQRVIRQIDPKVPVFDVRTMTSIIREATATSRYSAMLVGLFAVMALVLAAVGIHGLGAFAAAQRTREIGVRIALGATRGNILRLVVTQGLAPAIIGLVIGAGAAIAVTRLLSSLLYEVRPSDPLLFAGAIAMLLIVAFAASSLPALRATRIDPTVALRSE